MSNFSSHLTSAIRDLSSGVSVSFVYTMAVDNAGHIYGPDSGEVRDTVQEVDRALGKMFEELENAGLKQGIGGFPHIHYSTVCRKDIDPNL